MKFFRKKSEKLTFLGKSEKKISRKFSEYLYTMGQKLIITESEKNNIRGLYEQTDATQVDNVIGVAPSKLGLNPGLPIKDGSGAEVGKQYMGIGPNRGFVYRIMTGGTNVTEFDPSTKQTTNITLQQMIQDCKGRLQYYVQNTMKNQNTQQY
jgi:hypothetical protein